MAIAGVLRLTAGQLGDSDMQLKRWLADVSDRPNGFASIDLRGLSVDHRTAFHKAARAAYQELLSRDRVADDRSVTFHAMVELISMLDSMSRGEPPESPPTTSVRDKPPIPEDLTQLWNE
jgi:hypothetical protein